MKPLKIGLAQIYPQLGNLEANLQKHLEVIEDAVTRGADLIVFPELSLTGYVLQDLTYEVAIRPEPDHPILQPLLKASTRADLVVGFVERDERGRYYTTGAYLSMGRLIHRHRKVYLPTYGMFDEGRDMTPGDQVRAFDTRFGRFGLLICEDFWHISPPYILWLDGAEVLIFTSASPGRGLGTPGKLGSSRWVELVNQAYASLFTVFVIHVNRAGFEDGQNFWGGSTIFDPNGDLVIQGPYFDEALILATIDLDQIRRTRIRLPLLRDERPGLVLRELRRILGVEGSRD
ncbi:MAG: nitrilase-related carbon-nitrogen hydrolase [Thermoflexus sp.]